MKNLQIKHLFLILAATLFSVSTSFAQFWVMTGSKADSVSRLIFDRYNINSDEVPRFTHYPDKKSSSYIKQDSLKREYKRDSIQISFNNVRPQKVKDKNVYAFLVESPESEEVELSLDSVSISPGSYLYFVSKEFTEFGGPIGSENLKKGFKRLMNTSSFESGGIYVILVEPDKNGELRSHIRISGIIFKEISNSNSKARVASTSPSSHCYPHLNDQAYAVGRLETTALKYCTFSVVNNEAFDRKPLVLTARHCVKTLDVDPTNITTSERNRIEGANFAIAWRYNCGAASGENTRWVGTGSTYLASQWPSDHLLVELDDDLPMSINYLGWDRNDASNSTSVYALHHSGASPYNRRQHYSSGYISSQGPDKYTINWSLGETTGGASGGPILRTSDNKILGGLSHEAIVGDDKYFKLSNAWNTVAGPLKPRLSNVYNYSSLNALIPTEINGSKVLCYNATTTYTMPNLISGESVIWSVSGGLQILSSTANSVTVKAINAYIDATVTATYTVIKDADNPSSLLTDSRTFKVWLGGPFMSVTNTTTNHTSSSYVMNMNSSGTNNLHFNHELSSVSSVSWSFPSGWSVSGTSGYDVAVWSWSGTSSFTVTATNTCGSVSAFFHPNSSGFRMAAKSSTVYPNKASDYVRVSLNDADEWEKVNSVRIIDSGTSHVYYSTEFIDISYLQLNNSLLIDLSKITKGKYILEVKKLGSSDSHHLIIE